MKPRNSRVAHAESPSDLGTPAATALGLPGVDGGEVELPTKLQLIYEAVDLCHHYAVYS